MDEKELEKRKKAKVRRIKKELKRLEDLFADLPANEYSLILPLLKNMAFMIVELSDMKEIILVEGVVDTYQNGNNQSGRKASATLQSYNATLKQYNSISKRLEEYLPKEKQISKLEKIAKM